MFKKYLRIVILLCILILPNNVFALEKTITIEADGTVNSLYANYTWWDGDRISGKLRGELKSGTVTLYAEEKKGKYNITCDTKNYEKWYYKCVTSCGINKTKLNSTLQSEISYCKNYIAYGKDSELDSTEYSLSNSCQEILKPTVSNSFISSSMLCKVKLCKDYYEDGNGTCISSNGSVKSVFPTSTKTISNTYFNTKCGNDKSLVGNTTYGTWSVSIKPSDGGDSKYYTPTSYARLSCSWNSTKTGTVETSAKKLIQNKYITSNGAVAYCINPGKQFIKQDYILSTSYDLSTTDCSKSNNSKTCALAAAVSIGNKEFGGDYLTILTALRFISAYYGDSSGWWDSAASKTYSNANIYKHTINEISNGYAGATTAHNTLGVIYADANSNKALTNAITIYKRVMSGEKLWTPNVTYKYSSYNAITKTTTLDFESNFPDGTTISKIVLSNGKVIDSSSIQINPCESDNSKSCITATLSLEVNECTSVTATIYYSNSYDSISKVGYYIAKENPISYQEMYVFDKSAEATVNVKITNAEKFNLCNPDNSCSRDTSGNYICKAGNICTEEQFTQECGSQTPTTTYCKEPKLETDMPDDCEDDNTGRIEDATMCNILNSEDQYKEQYKTNDGNEFCKVYCRETLIFSFMDKETAYAGQSFKHSVGSYYSNKGYLSTVILSSKQCTSDIDYDSWLEQYNEANDKVLETWNELKDMEATYNHINDKKITTHTGSCGSKKDCCDNSCTESCATETNPNCTRSKCCDDGCKISCNTTYTKWNWNDFNYSYTNSDGTTVTKEATNRESGSYTCSANCCKDKCKSSAVSPSNTVVTDPYKEALIAYKNALDLRDKLLYQIQDCNFMSDNDSNNIGISTKTIYTKNTYGPYYTTKSEEEKYTTSAKLETYKNIVNNYEPGNTIEIEYDENYMYDMGYTVDIKNDQTKKYAVTIGYSDKEDWKDYCKGDCEGTLYDLSSTPYLTDETDKVNYWTCTGSETSAKCSKNNLVIPKNKIANIVVETETIHYQNSQFYTQVFTGKTSTSKDNTGYWITLDEHIYPVGAYRLSGNYSISLEYSNLGENKDMGDGSYTCSYDVINELTVYDCNDGYHVCYPCDENGDCSEYNYNSSLGVYYRNINLNDIFPNSSYSPNYSNSISNGSRNIGQNWLTTNAIQVIKEIQKNGENVWANKKPMYTITLTNDVIKNIRNYNSRTNYLDYSISCDDNLRCTSSFLTEFTSKYGNLFTKNSTIKSDSLYYYKRSW